jgi:hypothetical protein
VTLQAAVEDLAGRCDARKAPTISDDELTNLLEQQATVSLFAPDTVYARGQIVLPSTADLNARGPAYVIAQGGLAGSEPSTWPNSPGLRVITGSVQITWWGIHDGAPWDITEAARLALKLKIARCARLVDTADRDTKMQLSQMLAGYEAALKTYGPSSRGFF